MKYIGNTDQLTSVAFQINVRWKTNQLYIKLLRSFFAGIVDAKEKWSERLASRNTGKKISYLEAGLC